MSTAIDPGEPKKNSVFVKEVSKFVLKIRHYKFTGSKNTSKSRISKARRCPVSAPKFQTPNDAILLDLIDIVDFEIQAFAKKRYVRVVKQL